MNDEQLLRYSRQLMLPQIDVAGQEKLLNSNVLLIGLGGLGAPVSIYLAAAGIGHLILVDFDTVELSNLQRQIVHSTADLGRPKVESARDNLLRLNPDIKITSVNKKLNADELFKQIQQVDVVVEGSDNFATRFAVNAACVKTRTPLVSGAAIRMEGQVSVYLNDGNGPCYHCLYKDEGELDASCSHNGVLAPVVGIIGSIQATETIKVITEIGKVLDGRLLLLDAMSMDWRSLKLKKDPACPVCSPVEGDIGIH
ncbi:Molybdopterin-synthase adenylyltransferase [hydrothermal vent metagenome]|uniref:Molybdopterin-synthase adenylyltransferase n=1 Tax=hydrothermal vent metagenome TaxID=652676 RepID=A0A3B1C1X1_9ZZZZ